MLLSVETLRTALEMGAIYSLVALALFISFSILNIADLSTDGCYTLGFAVGAIVTLAGHPFLALPAAMLAGVLSGFVTAFLQTKLGVESILAGIIVNTGLYTVNLAVMGWSSNLSIFGTDTLLSLAKGLSENTAWTRWSTLIVLGVILTAVAVVTALFFRTRLGLSIRATGDNPEMVRASSINPMFTTTVGLCVANAFTGLSGCLLAQAQKQVDINLGQGMVTIALASLLIGRAFLGKGSILTRAVGVVLGAFLFRLVYAIALRFDMPAFLLKLVSSVIVIFAIAGPYLKSRWPEVRRRIMHRFAARKGGT